MIRNIIFDLCGPIITIDLNLMDQRFHELGVVAEHPYDLLVESGLTEEFECDRITIDTFCNEVRRILQCPRLSDKDIHDTWNTLITSYAPAHAQLIRRLKDKYSVFLLSNSDRINARFFHDYLNKGAGFNFLEECFDEAIFSYQTGTRKPDPKIFQQIVSRHGLNAEETLHIDDREMHCEGARKAGIQAYYLRPGTDICDLFNNNQEIICL